MSNGLKKYKVFFPINTDNAWLGGVNYYKNLFQAISMLDDNPVEIYIPQNNPEMLLQYAKSTNAFKKDIRYRLNNLKSFLIHKKFDKNEYSFKFMAKNMDIISHTCSFSDSTPCISWIPDFQHKKLPEFFSNEEIKLRDKAFLLYAEKSSAVILSSIDAKNYFVKYYPQFEKKARVLNFVSYISPDVYNLENEVNKKYSLPDKYFYLPNQFWQHKNHMTAFKALNHLKKQGANIHIVCSGNTNDYRNRAYFQNVILKYIEENNLKENIHILGIIDLNDVYSLMRNCVSIINPSLFEGWSSTVEEAKSLGKNMILSDLDVHKEQNPPKSIYFPRLDYEKLAEIMNNNWNKLDFGSDFDLEENAKSNMDKRMKDFGQKYVDILKTIV